MARAGRSSSVERGRFIHDGPHYFPESVVLYTRFEVSAIRQMFAYLREKESLMKKDVATFAGTLKEVELRHRLIEIETQLIWMVSNLR